MKLTDIKKVLILGSGTLGLRIGLQSAISGFETMIYDINEKAFGPAKKIQESILKNLMEKKLITPEEADDCNTKDNIYNRCCPGGGRMLIL